MIFTNNINDLISVNTDCYLHNKKYSSTKLFKYYNAKFIGYHGKRVIITKNNKIETGKGVLHRNIEDLNSVKDEIQNLNNKQQLSIDHLFVFTDDYGDRNICHWMTEQLLVLNYQKY